MLMTKVMNGRGFGHREQFTTCGLDPEQWTKPPVGSWWWMLLDVLADGGGNFMVA